MNYSDIDQLMLLLDKIDPKFRLLTDQLFFTDRTDLETADLAVMLTKERENYLYLWDRFTRALEIYWDEAFWVNRFELLLSLGHKKLVVEIGNILTSNFKKLLMYQYEANAVHHNSYIQFLAWAKAKSQKKESIIEIRDFLLGMPEYLQIAKLLSVVFDFIPTVFLTVDEYTEIVTKNISQSARNFDLLKQFEEQGMVIDKEPIFKMAHNLLLKRVPNKANRRSLFKLLGEPTVLAVLKAEYSVDHHVGLTNIIKNCDYKEIEAGHLHHIKNLLELDPTIVDDVMLAYAKSLYARGTGGKGVNIKRLIRLCKAYPQFLPKKILSYLSTNNLLSDVKLLVVAFPTLKTLVPFV